MNKHRRNGSIANYLRIITSFPSFRSVLSACRLHAYFFFFFASSRFLSEYLRAVLASLVKDDGMRDEQSRKSVDMTDEEWDRRHKRGPREGNEKK